MNRKLFASIAAASVAAAASASPVVYASYDFNGGINPDIQTVADGHALHFIMEQAGFAQGDAWTAYSDQGAPVAASPSMLDDAAAVNRKVMVFPEVFVRSADATVSFKAKSINEQSKKNLCHWQLVSINGADTTAIADGEAPCNQWDEVSVPIAGYAGGKHTFAIINDSRANCEVLAIDDVVFAGSPGLASVDYLPGRLTYGSDEIYPGIAVTATSPTPITSVRFTCTINGQTFSAENSTLNLTEGESAQLLAEQPVKVTLGEPVSYTIAAEVNGTPYDPAQLTTTAMLFETTKRVVLEEQTGTWCGWCPLGIVATDSLMMLYPDRVIPIAVHVGDDPMANKAYMDILGKGAAAPLGFFDRTEWCQGNPLEKVTVGREEKYTLKGAFGDCMERAIARTPIADVNVEVMKEGKYSLRLHCGITFAVNRTKANYKLVCVLAEEDVTGYPQANYLAGATANAPVGGYDAKDKIITDARFDHVARWIEEYTEGGKMGRIIPSTVEAGQTYSFDGYITVGNGINPDNCTVVCMLVDNADGHVENANSHTFYVPASVADLTADSDNAAYDLQGRRLAAPAGSLYIKGGRLMSTGR